MPVGPVSILLSASGEKGGGDRRVARAWSQRLQRLLQLQPHQPLIRHAASRGLGLVRIDDRLRQAQSDPRVFLELLRPRKPYVARERPRHQVVLAQVRGFHEPLGFRIAGNVGNGFNLLAIALPRDSRRLPPYVGSGQPFSAEVIRHCRAETRSQHALGADQPRPLDDP